MKQIFTLLSFICFTIIAQGQVTITPSPFEVDESITISVDINSTMTNCNGFTNPTKVYMHSGIGDESNAFGFSVTGNWGQDDGVGEMTNMGGGVYSITITPETYYGLNSTEASNASRLGMVFRNENGSQEFKATGCADFIFNVGALQVNLTNPQANETLIVTSGSNTTVTAEVVNSTTANFELKANGVTVNTNSGSTYNYQLTNITENTYCELIATQGVSTITKTFSILVNSTINETLPTGLKNGINYTSATTATLVLEAPLKDFVYVAGSFNNWTPTAADAMKLDSATSKFWLELTGLTSGQIETFQYWVGEETPLANSPALVKTADPYSTLVLSPFDDGFIPATSYPNIPTYPAGQEREVTVLQTGQTAYPWIVTDFDKPKKEDLVIYEVLIRDFDANRNYQDLIDRIDYFKNLNVNAIQLMPIMEFEGNESWGYNTSFHMALDKFYGTENKLKEFIDLCHQNGIAVILDVALNHAFGRNPMVRMWMDDPDSDGWGEPSSESPYFNEIPAHSYNVGSDFDHSKTTTRDYTKRVVEYWIEEFKIDGFRWDLTKGFTQNATNSETQTNNYQPDRVAVLKEYADYSWSVDPSHYVIFEHLGFGGSATEETEWANYRLTGEADGIPKGIMQWGKMTDPYNQLTMGYTSGSNINGMGHESRNFDAPRLVGYPESHDEERLMYKNLQFGNQSNPSHNVTELNIALSRMPALGAVSLTIPGPKMIWHFGALGMENSIFTCNNGTVNNPNCKLDTKPQPQWVNDWLGDANRNQIYNAWSRLNYLKINEPVFEGDYTINSGDLTPKIYLSDSSIPSTELNEVVILANFNVTSQNVTPNFPSTGTWYDLMDETGSSSITVTNTTTPITIAPGEFVIYGNQSSELLSVSEFNLEQPLTLYPNPTASSFTINKPVNKLEVFDVSGKLVTTFSGSFEKGNAFDISQIAKGLYIVKIETHSGAISTTKLIKL